MKYKAHEINNHVVGLAGWYIDSAICDRLVDWFEANPQEQKTGVLLQDTIDKSLKDSTDTNILPKWQEQPFLDYFTELGQVVEEYKKMYPMCDTFQHNWGVVEGVNIQRYKPGQGFHTWHCERTGPESAHRHMVFMTYLNDVTDGGETEWVYQKTKIKPEKGLTVIWSADYTFSHRGITSPTQTKYITTGWYGYIDDAQ